MRLPLIPLAFILATALPNVAGAVGCISGAVAGGVAGHYAGHHGLLGAAAGCVVGHHMHKVEKEREREEAARQHAYDSPDYRGDARSPDQTTTTGAGDTPH
jgi:hypothetical protein